MIAGSETISAPRRVVAVRTVDCHVIDNNRPTPAADMRNCRGAGAINIERIAQPRLMIHTNARAEIDRDVRVIVAVVLDVDFIMTGPGLHQKLAWALLPAPSWSLSYVPSASISTSRSMYLIGTYTVVPSPVFES